MNEHDATETAYKNGYARAKEDIIENINTRLKQLEADLKEATNPMVQLNIDRGIFELEELKKEIEKG